MGLEHVHCGPIFRVPEGNATVLISGYYLTALISPDHQPLLRLSLSVPDPLCQFLLAVVTDIKNCNVPIYIGGHQVIRCEATLDWRWLVLMGNPVLVQIYAPGKTSNADLLVCFYRRYYFRLRWNRIQNYHLARARSHEKQIPCDVMNHGLETSAAAKALRIYELASCPLIFLVEVGNDKVA